METKYLDTIKELKDNHFGIALKEYLKEEYRKIDTVKGVKTLEESRGREIALEVLDRLFKFLDNEEVKKVVKNNYT